MTNLSYLCNDNKFFSKVYCTHVFWFLSYSGNFLFGFFLLGCFPSFSFSETYFDQYFQRFQWYLILFIFNFLTFSDLHFFHFSKKKKNTCNVILTMAILAHHHHHFEHYDNKHTTEPMKPILSLCFSNRTKAKGSMQGS